MIQEKNYLVHSNGQDSFCCCISTNRKCQVVEKVVVKLREKQIPVQDVSVGFQKDISIVCWEKGILQKIRAGSPLYLAAVMAYIEVEITRRIVLLMDI